MGSALREAVVLKRLYAHRDFDADYNSYKGNAYGLANTLLQTAILKPRLKPGKVSNLYFAGQLVTQFHVPDFWSAFKGALVISLVTLIANHLTGGGGTHVTTRQQPRDRPPLRDDDDGPVIDV